MSDGVLNLLLTGLELSLYRKLNIKKATRKQLVHKSVTCTCRLIDFLRADSHDSPFLNIIIEQSVRECDPFNMSIRGRRDPLGSYMSLVSTLTTCSLLLVSKKILVCFVWVFY